MERDPSGFTSEPVFATEQERNDWREALLARARNRRADLRYPAELPINGWLDLEGDQHPSVPAQVVDVSAGGLCVLVAADLPVEPGVRGEFVSPTHAGPCSHKVVVARWRRCGPQTCLVGLAFFE
jgi:hypothetical protein